MSILEGVRPSKAMNGTKFIIKSKPSLKEKPAVQLQQEVLSATDHDVQQFLAYMIGKSKRFKDILQSKSITDETYFCDNHLYRNPCIRALLKAKFDNLLSERRIGKNLKGINRDLLQEIENCIWQTIERQIALYQIEEMYENQKSNLQTEIQRRKAEIDEEIHKLVGERIQKELVIES